MRKAKDLGFFYLAPAAWREPFVLTGAEYEHLARSVRGQIGDCLCLLDGRGRTGRFRIVGLTRREAALAPLEITTQAKPAGRAVLALGWSKALRRSWLLEKAVELEAGELWFWQARHSQTPLPEDAKELRAGALISGAKQCGNPWLPEVRLLPGGAAELLAGSRSFSARFLLHEDSNLGRPLRLADIAQAASPLFILGPEGGFAAEEVAAFAADGIEAVSLGRRVLRWETAALLCLGLAWWRGGPAALD